MSAQRGHSFTSEVIEWLHPIDNMTPVSCR
jgi:hypothetical protein